ncbi:MAG TPA: LysR family transcriptional regulator [Miltoncostaea sp.]|nr:LysR family transcriptional regulator [Miltoncostaea sp.]
MDARRLLVLRAIAEHRSFTRAAQQLVMTQPAVSRQLAALEAEVGVQLVIRGPRHVALTPAGAALVEESEGILPAIEAAGRRLWGFAAPDGGAVRLGAVPSALATLVPDALRALRARRPRVEVQVDEGWSADLERLTARGDLDLAVVSASGGAGPAGGVRLLREPFVALLPADGAPARRRRLALRDLAGEPWLVAPGPGGREAVLAACAAAGFGPRIAGTAGWDAAGRLIGAGLGVALAPERTAARVAREPGVVARPLADAPSRELRLVRSPRTRRTPVERDLEADLLEAAGQDARATT